MVGPPTADLMDPLDNAVWHALCGPQQRFAQGGTGAKRFDPAVAPFAALPDEPTPADWDELAALVGPGNIAMLFRASCELPAGWQELTRFSGCQMVNQTQTSPATLAVDELAPQDVDDMLALVAETEPGPFARRTIELGGYLGVRRDGVLVAMAGHRTKLPGYVEISAVCTRPSHRGQGLAAGLVQALVAGIRAGGDVPILHVVQENTSAIRLYESLGFAHRRAIDGLVLQAPVEPR